MSKLNRGDVVRVTKKLQLYKFLSSKVLYFPKNLITEISSVVEYEVVNSPEEADVISEYPGTGQTAYLKKLPEPRYVLLGLDKQNCELWNDKDIIHLKKIEDKRLKFQYNMSGPFIDEN